MESSEPKDFWVSYNKADENWATWIATVLEQADYTVVIQAWDFRPGNNFALEMQKAAKSARRTIAVVSADYIKSKFTQPEWAAAVAHDPTGEGKVLIPVIIRPCEVEGLLRQVIHINLIGLDEEAATQKLLAGIDPGRAKPINPPEFPGGKVATVATPTPRAADVEWKPLGATSDVKWLSGLQQVRRQGGATRLELHLIPTSNQNLEVRTLASLKDELVDKGRRRGLFSPNEGVESSSTAQECVSYSVEPRNHSGSGLLIARSGQRGFWFTLPHDSVGSIFDVNDIRPRLETLLILIMNLSVPAADRYSVAVKLSPCIMLNIGSASIIGVRSSASFPYAAKSPSDITVQPSDSVSSASIVEQTKEVAEEIAARLQAEL